MRTTSRRTRHCAKRTANTDFNSHTPMLDRYRRMIDNWKLTANQYDLTPDEITAILDS